ncbi:MAG: helix-turn-helix transcriptional regulator [Bacteroidota bacterium]
MHRIDSISDLHAKLGLPKPKHPLISWMDARHMHIPAELVGSKITEEFYMIAMKDKSCGADYGRHSFDFQEGIMVFSEPGQVYTIRQPVQRGDVRGWMLYFHPDLIRTTHLEQQMADYSFFNYEVFEALHLSEGEEQRVNDCVASIQAEYEQRIDRHSRRVIVSNLELLLNYCLRFYERQFHTRSSQSRDTVSQFEKELKRYFQDQRYLELGLPTIQYFAEKAHLSQHYFSDLLKKETGRSPKDHINYYLVERAKSLLLGSEQSVSEIAYDLGFNYPHYFARVFKSKTGLSPVQYRNQN